MNVLAIAAHPDDAEIQCFGTLAKCVQRGDTVTVATVTNGNLGHMVVMPEELGPIRIEEATAAAKVIGAEYVCLGADDLGFTHYDEEMIRRCTDLIRRVKPRVILTHFTDDYHRDHVETGMLVLDAAFRATIPHFFTDEEPFYGPMTVYHFPPSNGNVEFTCTDFVNIKDVIDLKLEALAQHKSQVKWLMEHDHTDVLAKTRTRGAIYGAQAKCGLAEGFRVSKYRYTAPGERLLP